MTLREILAPALEITFQSAVGPRIRLETLPTDVLHPAFGDRPEIGKPLPEPPRAATRQPQDQQERRQQRASSAFSHGGTLAGGSLVTSPAWRCHLKSGAAHLIASHATAAGYRADGLADRLGVAPRVLRRAVQDASGIAAKTWRVQVRSGEVRHRSRGWESISESAAAVGSSHAKELSRESPRAYQVTPAAYRLRERGAGRAFKIPNRTLV